MSADSRKALTAATKGFRRLPDDEKLPQVKPLLKLYQEEIDALTRRSRAAEKAFVAVFRTLADLPDPVPELRESVTNGVWDRCCCCCCCCCCCHGR